MVRDICYQVVSIYLVKTEILMFPFAGVKQAIIMHLETVFLLSSKPSLLLSR
jgi:hypothetical protein